MLGLFTGVSANPSTGRRCDACRKRKKKCDQRQPTCSRCSHLGIRCVGSGQPRYRFVDINSVGSKRQGVAKSSSVLLGNIQSSPCNAVVLLRGSILSLLNMENSGYDIKLLAPLIEHIPARLGFNSALDSAANSLYQACKAVQIGSPTIKAMESYTKALRSLRTALNDPTIALSINTVFAVYLILLSQVLVGNQLSAAHGEGIVLMLEASAAAAAEKNDKFADQLYYCMTGHVIFEAIVNPRIVFSSWLERHTKKLDQASPLHCVRMSQFSRLRDFIKDPIAHALEIRSSYQRAGHEILTLHNAVLAVWPYTSARARAIYCMARCLALSYTIVLNTIMVRSLEPFNKHLSDESDALLDEILALTEEAVEFIPLSVGSVSTMLLAAWPSALCRRSEIEKKHCRFEGKFRIEGWRETAQALDEWLDPELRHAGTRPSNACNIM